MKGWLTCAALLLVASISGCMAVSATDNSKGVRTDSEVVVVNGEVFLVNKRTCEARKIDLTCAKPSPTEKAEEPIQAGTAR